MAETREFKILTAAEIEAGKQPRTHGLVAQAHGLKLSKAQQDDIDNGVPVPDDQAHLLNRGGGQ